MSIVRLISKSPFDLTIEKSSLPSIVILEGGVSSATNKKLGINRKAKIFKLIFYKSF
jgi:hypothetical protein